MVVVAGQKDYDSSVSVVGLAFQRLYNRTCSKRNNLNMLYNREARAINAPQSAYITKCVLSAFSIRKQRCQSFVLVFTCLDVDGNS